MRWITAFILAGCGASLDVDTTVLGSVEGIDEGGNAVGWVLAPAFDTHPLEAAVYADGDAHTGTLMYTVRANRTRDDVVATTGVPGHHGFEFTVPDSLRDGAMHTLHVYALGPAGLVELTGSPQTVTLAGTGTGTPPRADGDTDVLGKIDSLDENGDFVGWALVPSYTTHPIQIAVFGDGKILFTARANVDRDDLQQQYGTAHHGFHTFVPDEMMDDEQHTLTIYGMGPKGMKELPGSPLHMKLSNPTPRGYVDGVSPTGVVNGWALAPSQGADPIDVDIFVDDPNGTMVATVHADQPREDVNETTGYKGDHGFSFKLPDALRDDADHQLYVVAHGPRSQVALNTTQFRLAKLFHARKGIVHADGRNYVDDDGAFYPLGGTVMWALYGWKNDRARLQQNLKFLAQHGYDYIRILAEVSWTDEVISPAWFDYAEQLGGLIDYAYDECGLRTEITMIGGGDGIDVVGLAGRIGDIVNAGRRHKILDIEIANESYQRPVTLDTMRAAGRALLAKLPGQLVALSSAEGLGTYVPNSTDFIADTKSTYLQSGTANLMTIHMDRTFGDEGWREARQPWDWKDFPFPIAHNEPIGPRSSVAQEVDPVRLAMLRAVGIINGVEGFVLHNGAGVMGKVDPSHDRPANLWEVPNIDAVMDAVRGVDQLLPAHAGDGQHWNNGWAGAPWNADAFWASGADHGVNRNYTVATADGWISTESGIKNYVVMTPSRHCRVEIFDVLQGKVDERELQAGQTLTLTPVSRDNNGDGGLIVIGHYL